ncbi:hypothetical protein [Lactiplantibacillus mudanjiangensis]|uniref:Uncharacterized protein n=1 Tax=Lactiplantibacillus mudanjiangensis TaxID=1296538 RepID=A0A660DXE9_9LACO|nr:hypothetical protein [Lactiplantibacillus mudanjiangensis]VDG26005.1 hypothetical protein MUDAN_IGPPGNFN_03532 [Lactiplantibacillus mudanjiangensis]VDG27897.1 hypothetical protein MUDAN_MDHGFNIF_02714 [Lactiplantibacillus mudanjiangensis]
MTFDEAVHAVAKLGLKHVWLTECGTAVRLMTDRPRTDWLIFANPRANSWQEGAIDAAFQGKVRDDPELSSKLEQALRIMNEFVDENKKLETMQK